MLDCTYETRSKAPKLRIYRQSELEPWQPTHGMESRLATLPKILER